MEFDCGLACAETPTVSAATRRPPRQDSRCRESGRGRQMGKTPGSGSAGGAAGANACGPRASMEGPACPVTKASARRLAGHLDGAVRVDDDAAKGVVAGGERALHQRVVRVVEGAPRVNLGPCLQRQRPGRVKGASLADAHPVAGTRARAFRWVSGQRAPC